jgi:hypothetical protein
MSNVIKINNKTYKCEFCWRPNKDVKIYDINNKLFEFPIVNKNKIKWQNKDMFLIKLKQLETYLISKNKFIKEETSKCLLCDNKSKNNNKNLSNLNIKTKTFELNNLRWDDLLYHYVEVHDLKPSEEFIDIIFRFEKVENMKTMRLQSSYVIDKNKRYLKLDKNQILILDALLIHGSKKIYNINSNNINNYKYSEHYGLLDFNHKGLEKLLISGNTTRIDEGDDEILMPKNIDQELDYEYIFHTHPPTPKPGGRSELGILYESPSISDIFHFVDHFNRGSTQGSIIIASEGMYIIRKLIFDRKKIKLNENKFYKEYNRIYDDAQSDALNKYGYDFSTSVFYSKISQDRTFINDINKTLNKFELHIDYYSRVKDSKNNYIIDTVYLPIFVVELK